MAEITIDRLAKDIGTDVDRLIKQLAAAGIEKDAQSMVSEEEKSKLLAHLNRSPCCLAGQYKLTHQRSVRASSRHRLLNEQQRWGCSILCRRAIPATPHLLDW